jgi:hypothetical protein
MRYETSSSVVVPFRCSAHWEKNSPVETDVLVSACQNSFEIFLIFEDGERSAHQ